MGRDDGAPSALFGYDPRSCWYLVLGSLSKGDVS